MLKKLFLSIIILSALASEGGAYLSADLIDYYLVNFSRLDIMQVNSAGQSSGSGVERKKGTPAAFFKAVSQNAIDLKNTVRNKYSDFTAIPPLSAGVALLMVFSICFFNIKKSTYFRRYFLSLTDSSPPAACRI